VANIALVLLWERLQLQFLYIFWKNPRLLNFI